MDKLNEEQTKILNAKLASGVKQIFNRIDSGVPAKEVIAEAFGVSTEQTKRAELLEQYEKEITPDRDARNTAIEAHEKEFGDKWAALQGDIAKVRSDVGDRLVTENVPQKQRDQVLAMETAKLVEQHEAAKHEAALKLDKELPKVKKWVDFLEEKSIGGDPAVLDLLEEAKKSPEASLSGESDGKPRPVVLADLTFKADKDGVRYLRGKDEIITDRGHRIDVKRLDDRDIQAALQIASQKFDMDKGLVLSGDMAFRTRSAELAGRMGFKIQNPSPEMQKAWDRGQRSTAVLKQHERPNLSNGISGDARKPDMVVLKVDPRLGTPEKMQTTGLDVRFGEAANEVLMEPEAYMGAMDAWRNSDFQTLETLAHADITVPDGGIDTSELAANAPEFVDGDSLSTLAKEVVLVRDAKTLDARELATDKSIYLTSQDRVAADREQQRQVDQSLTSRNIDAQDVEKAREIEKSRAEKAKEVAKESVAALPEHEHEGIGF